MATKYAPPQSAAQVSFYTLSDGSVNIVATGRNGTLSLHIDGRLSGPSMDIPLSDHERVPGKPYQYKAVWGLEANGQLRGWLAEEDGKIKWFPERAKRKPKKAYSRRVK